MKRFIILLVLIIGFSYMYSCSGCSESGRRAEQRARAQNGYHTPAIMIEAVPTYYIITRVTRDSDILVSNIVRYTALPSIEPLPSHGRYGAILFYDYNDTFNIGDTINLKLRTHENMDMVKKQSN